MSDAPQAVTSEVDTASIRRKRMRSTIFILPNAITVCSLFFGFLSMKFSNEGRFMPEHSEYFLFAAYALMAAAVCDGLDGSVARWTRTQSAFGVQLDSLCDLVSFGIAPAMLAYNFALHDVGRVGFGACFAYATCAALRLARFNVQSQVGKASGNFTGIPTPMAAAPIAVYVLAQSELLSWLAEPQFEFMASIAGTLTHSSVKTYVLLGVVVLISFGMISTFEYISTKTIRLPRKYPFRVLAMLMMVAIFLLTWQFVIMLAIALILYSLHGPVMWLVFKRDRGDEEEELFASDEEDES